MPVLLTIITVVLVLAVVWFVLPKMPRWVRVGFWGALTLLQVVEGDALFSAVYAAITVSEWNKP